jgi:MoxR-like ATPase
MPRDDALQSLFADLADSSGGEIGFRVTTSRSLAQDSGLELAQSPNPIYVFTITGTSGEQLTCVAFTLALDGIRRPATRAEALGKSLANSEGQLFNLNPFLLVYDYAGNRLLAVSAIDLFGAFATHASGTVLPYSGTASFSLTPNFQHSTINMYAELRQPAVWATSTVPDDFSTDGLVTFLKRVAGDTAAKNSDIPAIVEAVKTRLRSAPSEPESAAETALARATLGPEYVDAEPQDEDVQVEDRLWHIILGAIASSAAVILVGPPGTGKSALVRKAVRAISVNRQASGQPGIKAPLWATPDESWTSRELIGGETVAEGEIVFRPGWVLRAIAEERWLVLDEANRGDLDRIFGALLTWLAGEKVTVGVESPAEDAKLIELGWTPGQSRVETVEGIDGRRGAIRYLAGESWRLLGTYNALDTQRVFRIGAALGRRFVRVPIPPIPPSLFNQVLERRAADLPGQLRANISLLYNAHYQEEVTRLGPALFLGMCNYLRTALHARALGPSTAEPGVGATTSVNAEQSGTGPASEAGAEDGGPEAEAAVVAEENAPARAPSTLDSILSEAYVLNLGTLLAQLEDPDFEQLAYRIRSSSALPEAEVEWVSVMMRALA